MSIITVISWNSGRGEHPWVATAKSNGLVQVFHKRSAFSRDAAEENALSAARRELERLDCRMREVEL